MSVVLGSAGRQAREGQKRKARRLCIGLVGAACSACSPMQHSKAGAGAIEESRKARFLRAGARKNAPVFF
jgi:hypothetical protein